MSPTLSDIGCPTCSMTGASERITDTGSGYVCPKGHRFNDTGELMAMSPKMMPLPKKAPVRMLPGYEKLEVFIPGNLKVALDSKYGERLDATLVAICTSLMDSGAFIVSSADIGQISTKYFGGKTVRHSSELTGEIYSLFKGREDLQEQLQKTLAKLKQAGNAISD